MVAGVVRAPALDITNEELVRSHLHAIWLARSEGCLVSGHPGNPRPHADRLPMHGVRFICRAPDGSNSTPPTVSSPIVISSESPSREIPISIMNSVGHYEGDALVIDTVGFKIGPFSMVDWYGAPYTQALHVTERYRLVDDDEAVKSAEERGTKHLILLGHDVFQFS
jgi:hypothetical protein